MTIISLMAKLIVFVVVVVVFVTQGNSNEVINLHVSNKIFSLPAVLYFIAIGLRI